MRVAIASDIHGNLSALEAVIADIGRRAPDRVLHGGDLVLMGPRPAAVVDRLRELRWEGVLGTPTSCSGARRSWRARNRCRRSWHCSCG